MKEASYNTVSQQQLDAQFMQQYQLQHHIGSGGYGFVMSAIDRITKRKVAVKFINKAKNPRLHNQVPSEIKILQEIHHPSVIEYIDHFEDSLYHYLIMELYGDVWSDGPKLSITPAHRRVFSSDLFECIESHVKLTELQAQKIFKQIAQCVSDLSDLGIYHRDIKDENIVVDAKFKVNIVSKKP
jgi:serine/threonine protein kinase